MTRDEAIAQVHQLLGFRSGLATEITDGLKFQQSELEKSAQLPYFLREETTALTCTASNENMAVPTGFIRVWEDDELQVQNTDGDWSEVKRDSPKYLRSVYQGEEGIPVAYSLDVLGSFKLFPTPDAAYTFRLTYYKEDDLLTTNIENKWLKHLPYLLIGRAGAALAAAMGNQQATQTFVSLIQSETVKLNEMSTDRDGARRYVIGGDD